MTENRERMTEGKGREKETANRQPTTDYRLPTTRSQRCCAGCMYATRVECRSLAKGVGECPCVLICVNTVAAPGQMREVAPTGVCKNFCVRRAKPSPRAVPPKPPNDQVRHIALTKGKFAIVDACDYERLNQHRWFAMKADTTFYAIRNSPHGMVLMHREIIERAQGRPRGPHRPQRPG